MKKTLFIFSILLLITTAFIVTGHLFNKIDMSGAPPYGEPQENVPYDPVLPWLGKWERPDGPAKVTLQVGHWKSEEHPEELKKLRGNTGAKGGGKVEWEVNYAIADLVKERLDQYEIEVEILPATVPPKYWADVFLAIHADGSTDSRKSGFKIAAPWRDYSGGADKLVSFLEEEYKASTELEWDDNITRNMRGYYAFSWWRYDHAIHPMTTAAILETGFLTNPSDRKIIVDSPETSAKAITKGIIKYLETKELI